MVLDSLLRLDDVLFGWAQAQPHPRALTLLMLGASLIGGKGLVWLASGAALARIRRAWYPLALLAGGALLASVLTDGVLKPLCGRSRPFVRDAGVRVLELPPPRGASFPSGHAANAGAGAVLLTGLAPAWTGLWWAVAVVIAFSRVYLGVHYPFDVVAGLLVGAGAAILARSVLPAGRSLPRAD